MTLFAFKNHGIIKLFELKGIFNGHLVQFPFMLTCS